MTDMLHSSSLPQVETYTSYTFLLVLTLAGIFLHNLVLRDLIFKVPGKTKLFFWICVTKLLFLKPKHNNKTNIVNSFMKWFTRKTKNAVNVD